MIATHIRTKTLTLDEYRDLKLRAKVEKAVAEELSPLCDRYSISWAQCILMDPFIPPGYVVGDELKDATLTRGMRCVGKGTGEMTE